MHAEVIPTPAGPQLHQYALHRLTELGGHGLFSVDS